MQSWKTSLLKGSPVIAIEKSNLLEISKDNKSRLVKLFKLAKESLKFEVM
jgi:hypothetical protein